MPFSFALDGQTVQEGVGSEMMLAPGPALAAADALFEVVPGDWLFTGTPAGALLEEREGGRRAKPRVRALPRSKIFSPTHTHTHAPHTGVGPVTPGQVGRLIWGDRVDYEVRFV